MNTVQTTSKPLTTVREILEPRIRAAGGWVNAHVHADRAYTISPEMLRISQTCTLQEKWDAIDQFKRESTEVDYYDRFSRFFEEMIKQGCTACGSYVDIDPIVEERAIQGGMRARERFAGDITVKFINQAIKGVIAPEARHWFDVAASLVDIIGGIPMRDEIDHGKGFEAINVLLGTAKEQGKLVQLHIDQFDSITEAETELLCTMTRQTGMVNRVSAVHCISVAAHTLHYRERVYAGMKESGLMAVCCPTSWLDTRRSEHLTPRHNAITPVDEMIKAGVIVALGTDNVSDAVLPWSHGDMWTELRILATACHINDFDALVDIATVNGRKVLGI